MASITTRSTSRIDKSGAPAAAVQQAVTGQAPPKTPEVRSIADLYDKLSEFSTMISAKLDNLSTEVSSINRRIDDIEVSVANNSASILEIEKEKFPILKADLTEQIKQLENKITRMEIYNRKSNLLFYGLEEERREDIGAVLRKAFTTLGLSDQEASSISIVNAHRLPRRNADAADNRGPSPVIAKFSFMKQRERILTAYDELQRKRPRATAGQSDTPPRMFSVRTDLPPALKIQRGILAQQAYKMRREKGLSTRIITQDVNVILQWKVKGTAKWNNYENN